jgi:hypothetical protein
VSAPFSRHDVPELLGLAGAEERRGVRLLARLDQRVEHLRAGGLRERGELGEGHLGLVRVAGGGQAGEHDPLQAELPVLDLRDVLQLRRQPGDPAQRLPVGEVLLVTVETGGQVDVGVGVLLVSCHRPPRIARRPGCAEAITGRPGTVAPVGTLTVVTLLAGLVVLVVGGELLVRGAVGLARSLGMSPLLVGLTVVAFATSAPELAVSLDATFAGNPGLAVGNVVGSNIANVLLVLGLSAVVLPLLVSSQLVRTDVPVMVGLSVLTLLLALDGAWVVRTVRCSSCSCAPT